MFSLSTFPGILRLLPVVALAMAAAGQTIPPGYEIVDITSNNGRAEELTRINNRGQVVFSSRIPGSLTDSEIWLYDSRSGELTQITDDDVYDISPDINDEGTIVWSRSLGPWDPELRIFTFEIMMRTSDGVVTRITHEQAHDVGPRLNNLGEIVWYRYGIRVCGSWTKDVYLYDGSQVVPITSNGASENLQNQTPVINDLGQIVWTEYDTCDPPFPYNFTSRTMLYDEGEIRSLPTNGVAPQAPDINDLGLVTWKGFDPLTFRDTVELWDGASTTLIADDGGGPSINHLGHIAFDRWDDALRLWRVELYRDAQFLTISNELVHSFNPQMNDRSEVTWAYGPQLLEPDIRLMRRFPLGDLNCDGAIDAFDIEPFVTAMVDPEAYAARHPQCDPLLADVNGDTVVDSTDIEPFIHLLIP